MITNYQTIRGISPTYQDAVLGGILLLAMIADRLIRGGRREGGLPPALPRRVVPRRHHGRAGGGLFVVDPARWLNGRTLQSIVTQNGRWRVVAMAMTFSIISRHIDLSPGSMLALFGRSSASSTATRAASRSRCSRASASCIASGSANGILVSGLGLNAIMVTLATYIWARGLAVGLTHGNPIVVDGGLPT